MLRTAPAPGCAGRRRRRASPHEVLPQRVFEALDLPIELYAVDPDGQVPAAATETERALREVLAYRIYQDLRRGWRVTSPNLEQCGLLEIDYASLDDLCAAQEEWAEHPSRPWPMPRPPPVREIAKTLLDYLRRELAIKVDYLDPVYQESIRQLSSQRLREPWAIDENEQLAHSYRGLSPQPAESTTRQPRERLLSPAAAASASTCAGPARCPTTTRSSPSRRPSKIIVAAVRGAAGGRAGGAGAGARKDPEDVPGYKVPASALIWQAGDGTEPLRDASACPRLQRWAAAPTLTSSTSTASPPARLHGCSAREHTAQVPSDERQEREEPLPQGRAAAALLLAHHGAGRRHRPTQRGQHAQRAAHAGQLRPAQRPRRAQRPAGPGLHLLHHRQPPRPVFLQAAAGRWCPARSRRRASTWPTRTWCAPTSMPSGWPRPAVSWARR